MATKHTENYQLNLWEPGDSFLRTEFNENSAKIDATLKGHDTRMDGLAVKSSYEHIRTVTSTSDASTFSVNMAGINWDQWARVVLRFQLKGTGQMTISPNNTGSGVFCGMGSTGHASFGLCAPVLDSTATDYTLVLPCGRDSGRILQSFFYGNVYFCYGYVQSVTYADISTLDLAAYRSDGPITFYAGCKAEVYGIR